jgi:multiple sugar transport system ATP-binding protein
VAQLTISGAHKRFGETDVLRDVSVDVADGEFAVIVGPSGCGKSTLLRAVAGLEQLDAGDIVIGERDVGTLSPAARGVAMVFQSYALYPHLTVYQNMAFALRIGGQDKAGIDTAVRHAARILDIEALLDRKPAALSGGQRQRAAIGRAIVRQPKLFLFDEPLSNLDADLRVRMRYEFAALHRLLGTTTLYVTHDQVEAMTLADKVIVMREGRIEQVGAPRDLYDAPANLFVAGFMGSPRMNLLPVAGDGAAQMIGIRPEDIQFGDHPQARAHTVRYIERIGGFATVHLRETDAEADVVAQVRDDGSLREGDVVPVWFPPERLHRFDAAGLALPKGR